MRRFNVWAFGLACTSTGAVAAIGALWGAKAAAVAALVGLALQSQAHPVAPHVDVVPTDGDRVNAALQPEPQS